MTTFTIGMVAHESRRRAIRSSRTRCNVVCIDDGTLGCEANHQRTIRNAWLEHCDLYGDSSGWVVIIEDDALLCRYFRRRIDDALCNVPNADVGIVSFYLGTGHPRYWQPGIKKAIRQADAQRAPWIMADHHLLHAVAYAVRVTDVPAILNHLDGLELPIDNGLTEWARENGVTVGYTWPSLVDHRDTPSLIHPHGARPEPRRAHRVGKPRVLSQESVHLEYIGA